MKRGEKNAEVRARCLDYLKRAGSMPDAKRLAKEEGFSANSSVWIGALSEMFDKRSK